MDLTFTKTDFVRATSWAAGAAASRAPANGTHAVVIAVSGPQQVMFAGYDAAREARAVIPAAVSDQPRRVGLQAALLAEMATLLPADRVQLSVKDSHVEVTSGTARFRLQMVPLDHHPLAQGDGMPPFPEVVATASSADLARAVTQTASSVYKENELPQIGAINTVIADGKVTLESTNKYRLAVANFPADTPSLIAPLLVPGADFAKAVKGMRADKVILRANTTDLVLTSGDLAMRIRLSSGTFPKTAGLVPADAATAVSVSKDVLISLLRRACLFASREGDPASITLDPAGSLAIAAGQDHVAGVAESVAAGVTGRKHKFDVGAANLLSIVSPIRQDQVVMEFGGALRTPFVVFGDKARDEYFGVVMPVVRGAAPTGS